jgi:hypothetical protein
MDGGAPLQGHPARGERIRGVYSSSTRDCSSPSSTFSAMMSPDRTFHSSNHTRSPACFSRSASRRTRGVSFALWLKKTSYWKLSAMLYLSGQPLENGVCAEVLVNLAKMMLVYSSSSRCLIVSANNS